MLFDFLQKYLSDVLEIEFGFSKDNNEQRMQYYQFINKMNITINLVSGVGDRLSIARMQCP